MLHLVHHHCHAITCHTSSLSRHNVSLVIIVLRHLIRHHCQAVHHHCHAATSHTSYLSRHNIPPFSGLGSRHNVWHGQRVGNAVTLHATVAIHHHCHAVTSHTSSVSGRNIPPFFWPWQQTQCVGRPAGGHRTSSMSRYMTYVIIVTLHLIHHHCHAITCHSSSLLRYISYISIVTP